jgi:hypothetical protein
MKYCQIPEANLCGMQRITAYVLDKNELVKVCRKK